MKVKWCEEGVCGCGGGERHMHCSVAEPCRMESEELVGISHTIGQVYIVWLVSVYSVVPGANLEGLCVVLLL